MSCYRVIVLQFLLLLIATQCKSLELKCNYRRTDWGSHFTDKIYACKIENEIKVTDRNQEVTKISGRHLKPNSDDDVTGIHMQDMTVYYLPTGIDKIFTGLLGLSIQDCGLKELTKNDLKPFKKLQHLFIIRNHLEVLEKDLFMYNKGLRYINFNDNNIKEIDGRVFDDLKLLGPTLLLKNKCIDLATGPKLSSKKLKNEVRENCWTKKNESAEDEKEVTKTVTSTTLVTTTRKVEPTIGAVTSKKPSLAERVKKYREKVKEQKQQEESLMSKLWMKIVIGVAVVCVILGIIVAVALKHRKNNRIVSDIPN